MALVLKTMTGCHIVEDAIKKTGIEHIIKAQSTTPIAGTDGGRLQCEPMDCEQTQKTPCITSGKMAFRTHITLRYRKENEKTPHGAGILFEQGSVSELWVCQIDYDKNTHIFAAETSKLERCLSNGGRNFVPGIVQINAFFAYPDDFFEVLSPNKRTLIPAYMLWVGPNGGVNRGLGCGDLESHDPERIGHISQ
jgi:hypothetical protein